MHARPTTIIPPPAPTRASPFKVKGVLFHGTIAFFERNHPRGYAGLVEAAGDPHVKEFLRQNFLAGGTYDVMRVPALIDLEARFMQLDRARYLDKRTRWQAERDIDGVYRVLLKLASPEMTITRLPKVITQMFNFGQPTSTAIGPRHHRVEVSGIPTALEPWLRQGFTVYSETALAASGAARPIVRALAPHPEQAVAGYSMSRMRFELLWDA